MLFIFSSLYIFHLFTIPIHKQHTMAFSILFICLIFFTHPFVSASRELEVLSRQQAVYQISKIFWIVSKLASEQPELNDPDTIFEQLIVKLENFEDLRNHDFQGLTNTIFYKFYGNKNPSQDSDIYQSCDFDFEKTLVYNHDPDLNSLRGFLQREGFVKPGYGWPFRTEINVHQDLVSICIDRQCWILYMLEPCIPSPSVIEHITNWINQFF